MGMSSNSYEKNLRAHIRHSFNREAHKHQELKTVKCLTSQRSALVVVIQCGKLERVRESNHIFIHNGLQSSLPEYSDDL